MFNDKLFSKLIFEMDCDLIMEGIDETKYLIDNNKFNFIIKNGQLKNEKYFYNNLNEYQVANNIDIEKMKQSIMFICHSANDIPNCIAKLIDDKTIDDKTTFLYFLIILYYYISIITECHINYHIFTLSKSYNHESINNILIVFASSDEIEMKKLREIIFS